MDAVKQTLQEGVGKSSVVLEKGNTKMEFKESELKVVLDELGRAEHFITSVRRMEKNIEEGSTCSGFNNKEELHSFLQLVHNVVAHR